MVKGFALFDVLQNRGAFVRQIDQKRFKMATVNNTLTTHINGGILWFCMSRDCTVLVTQRIYKIHVVSSYTSTLYSTIQ